VKSQQIFRLRADGRFLPQPVFVFESFSSTKKPIMSFGERREKGGKIEMCVCVCVCVRERERERERETGLWRQRVMYRERRAK
jgi:hypothetical protein